jgi:CO/xanthine dehydrogenase Mo-binding subunit
MGARYFGAAVRRREDPRFLRGEGRFVDDIKLPGLLHAAFVRSPHAHASIRAIRPEAAARAPGVARVFTFADLARWITLHPLQEAFWAHHGLQCGFCTPAILLTAQAFLREHPAPTREAIREMLAGTLCRCTGYHFIVEAIHAAAHAGPPAAGGRPGGFDRA